MMKKILTIAGSDSGGGAGIQADLKTITMLGEYGASVITAITAQNTVGVQGVYEVPLEGIAAQLDAVCQDIAFDGVKTGMLSSKAVVELICGKIKEYRLPNVVVDPVMVATSGAGMTLVASSAPPKPVSKTTTSHFCSAKYKKANAAVSSNSVGRDSAGKPSAAMREARCI